MRKAFVWSIAVMFVGMQPVCRAMATKEEVDQCILKNLIYEKERREKEIIQDILGGSVFLALGLTAAQRAFDSSHVCKAAQPKTELFRQALRSSRMGRILSVIGLSLSASSFGSGYCANLRINELKNEIEQSKKQA